MTISEAVADLATRGVRRAFHPIIEPETGAVLLKTKRPAQLMSGILEGCEIAMVPGGFKVWTSRARKAKTLAARHGVKVRLLEGEAELTIPNALADEVLPEFGARVRREMTQEQRQACRERLTGARNALNSPQKLPEECGSEGMTAQKAPWHTPGGSGACFVGREQEAAHG